MVIFQSIAEENNIARMQESAATFAAKLAEEIRIFYLKKKKPQTPRRIDKSLATFTASLAIQFPKYIQNLQKKKKREKTSKKPPKFSLAEFPQSTLLAGNALPPGAGAAGGVAGKAPSLPATCGM